MSRHYRSSEITQRAICDALKGPMAQKPLSRITISEIMNICGMRRQHFVCGAGLRLRQPAAF